MRIRWGWALAASLVVTCGYWRLRDGEEPGKWAADYLKPDAKVGDLLKYRAEWPKSRRGVGVEARLLGAWAAQLARGPAPGAPPTAAWAQVVAHQMRARAAVPRARLDLPAREVWTGLDAVAAAGGPPGTVAPLASYFGSPHDPSSKLGHVFVETVGASAPLLVDTDYFAEPRDDSLEVVAACDASLTGVTYRLSGSPRQYPGVALECTMAVALPGTGTPLWKTVVTSHPTDSFTATVMPRLVIGLADDGTSTSNDDDVFAAMLDEALAQVVKAFVADLRGEAPPPAPVLSTPSENLRKWCEEKDDPQACLAWGRKLSTGAEGVARDPVAAAKHLTSACHRGNAGGCVALAEQALDEEGDEADARAWVRIENGCYMDAGECWFFEARWLLGDEDIHGRLGLGARRKDAKLGRQRLEKACDKGWAPACERLHAARP